MSIIGLFGEWDRLHEGHMYMLNFVFSTTSHDVLIAVIDNANEGSGKWKITPIGNRVAKLNKYIKDNGWKDRISDVVQYDSYPDMVSNAHLQKFDYLYIPDKDKERSCTKEYIEEINSNFKSAGGKPPTVVWTNTLYIGEGPHPWSSSKIRRITERYEKTGKKHPQYDAIKDYAEVKEEVKDVSVLSNKKVKK